MVVGGSLRHPKTRLCEFLFPYPFLPSSPSSSSHSLWLLSFFMAASASAGQLLSLRRCPVRPSTFAIVCLCFGLAFLTGTTESATPLRIYRPGSHEVTKDLKADITPSSQLRVVKEQPWKMRESLWSSVTNSNCLRPVSMANTTFNINYSSQ